MTPCAACKALVGEPSSKPPHGDLGVTGSRISGSATHPAKLYDEYRCTVCGNAMRRNTRDGDPPGVWSVQN